MIAVAALVSALADSASAGILEHEGSTVGAAQWNRPITYHVCEIRASMNASDTVLSEQECGGYLVLHQRSVNPNAQLANLVAANDDHLVIGASMIAANLTAGVSHFIVTAGFAPGEESFFRNTVRGEGEITKAPAPGVLAMAGLLAARRRRA
jgi:hypothetical protein